MERPSPHEGGSEIARLRRMLETPEERKFHEATSRDYEYGSPEGIRKHIMGAVEQIEKIKIPRSADVEQKQAIKEAKAKFFENLLESIESCRQYHNVVAELERQSRRLGGAFADEETRRDVQKDVEESDIRRRRKHEAMMDRMRIAMRLGRWYFDNDFKPEEVANKELRKKIQNMPHKRIDLPDNIFSPKNPALGSRQEWGDLAEQVYEAFLDEPELEKQIEKTINKYRKEK